MLKNISKHLNDFWEIYFLPFINSPYLAETSNYNKYAKLGILVNVKSYDIHDYLLTYMLSLNQSFWFGYSLSD